MPSLLQIQTYLTNLRKSHGDNNCLNQLKEYVGRLNCNEDDRDKLFTFGSDITRGTDEAHKLVEAEVEVEVKVEVDVEVV